MKNNEIMNGNLQSDNSCVRGIYIDEPFTQSLIARGYFEGLISTYTNGECDYEQHFLSTADPKLAIVALRHLVLYDTVYLAPCFDNFRIDGLVQQGVVRLPDPGLGLSPSLVEPNPFVRFHEQNVVEAGLLYPALAYLRSNGYPITERQVLDMLRRGDLQSHGHLLAKWFNLQREKESGRLSLITEEELSRLDRQLSLIRPVWRALDHVTRLIKASTALHTPALWNCHAFPERNAAINLRPDDSVVAAIYFRELKRVKVNSLSEAVELRENPFISEFRQEVFDITERVRIGVIDEAAVEKRIRVANKILESSKLADSVGTLITVAGIPALAVPVLGTVLTFAGVSLVAAKHVARWKYRWALISNC